MAACASPYPYKYLVFEFRTLILTSTTIPPISKKAFLKQPCVESTFLFQKDPSMLFMWRVRAMSSTFQSMVFITHVPPAAICSLYQNQRTPLWMVLSVRKDGEIKLCFSPAVTKKDRTAHLWRSERRPQLFHERRCLHNKRYRIALWCRYKYLPAHSFTHFFKLSLLVCLPKKVADMTMSESFFCVSQKL